MPEAELIELVLFMDEHDIRSKLPALQCHYAWSMLHKYKSCYFSLHSPPVLPHPASAYVPSLPHMLLP